MYIDVELQLTREQGFELHGSTYMQIFFRSNTIVLHGTWLVESDVAEEPQIQRADCKLYVD